MAGASVKTKQKNKNALKNIAKGYKKDYIIRVGFPESKAGSVQYPDGERVTDIAAQNEFGSESMKIPARPFMKKSTKPISDFLKESIPKLVKKINRRASTKKETANTVAPFTSAIIKKSITDLKSPPNAPLTITKKGSANPLIDTGLMRQTVSFEIKEGSGGE